MMAAADPIVLFEEARRRTPNPFSLEPVIAAEEVWGEVMTNLPNLNQHIDQQVRQAIDEVRQKISSKVGVTIQGNIGTGKSHAIRRIWKEIEREGIAVFSYIPPCDLPNQIDSHVRLNLCLDFARPDSNGVTQWQKLATIAVASLKGTEYEDQFQDYIAQCNHPARLRAHILSNVPRNQRENFIDELVEAIQEKHPELDFDFLKAALFTIFRTGRISQIGLSWLKGEDHPLLRQVGLPDYSSEERAARSVWTIQQTCKLAELGNIVVVICFDQIEAYNPNLETGDGKAQVAAKCIDRIYFQCSNTVLLSCLINDTWLEIKHMGGGIPDRVGQRAVFTKPPTADQLVDLVQLRLAWFFQKSGLSLDNYPRLYPFSEDELRKVAEQSVSTRDFFQKWCAKKFTEFSPEILAKSNNSKSISSKEIGGTDKNNSDQKKEEFLGLYEQILGKVNPRNIGDEKTAQILALAFQMLPDASIDGVTVKEVSDVDAFSSHDLHLIISGHDSNHQKDIKIGVRVCETTVGKTFNAAMKRLLDYDKYGLTRGCLVRSTPIPPSWKKGTELKQQLVEQQGGEVVVLKKEEFKPLAAIERIYQQAQDYGFDHEELLAIVKDLGWVAKNPLIREILSAPEPS
jgi:hypothetical protein